MSTFREFLNESKNKYGKKWEKYMGDMAYWYTIQNSDAADGKAFASLLTGVFGMARTSSSSSASSAARAKVNKFMLFTYGFSNATLDNYTTLNNKQFSIKDFINIVVKKGVLFEDVNIIPFGNGIMTYNENSQGKIAFYESVSDFINYDFFELLSMYDYDEDQISDINSGMITDLNKLR